VEKADGGRRTGGEYLSSGAQQARTCDGTTGALTSGNQPLNLTLQETIPTRGSIYSMKKGCLLAMVVHIDDPVAIGPRNYPLLVVEEATREGFRLGHANPLRRRVSSRLGTHGCLCGVLLRRRGRRQLPKRPNLPAIDSHRQRRGRRTA
jgi:hypothetical protein